MLPIQPLKIRPVFSGLNPAGKKQSESQKP